MKGFNIFRLKDRLHAFHGSKIWWIPLMEEVTEDSKKNLVEFIWQVHQGHADFKSAFVPTEIIPFFDK